MTSLRRLLPWLAVAVLAVVAALSAWRYDAKIAKPSEKDTLTRSAVLRWRDQIEDLHRGVDIYARYNYPNPPIQALILSPLNHLPRRHGALVWYCLKLGMAALMWVWAVRLLERAGDGPVPFWAKALAGLFALHPILGDLSHGNVNIFIAFLVFGALEAFRRGWPAVAGVVLALAIACKVTPALFLPYFGWKAVYGTWQALRNNSLGFAIARQRAVWTLLAGTAAGLALWLVVVPGLVLGHERNAALLESWYATMVKPFLVEGKITSEHANQSLPGLTTRLLRHEPSVVGYDENDRPVAGEYRNIADIGPANVQLLIRGYQLAYVLGLMALCRADLGVRRGGMRFAAECSYVLVGMLLFSERTWKHHGVVMLLPFLVSAAYFAVRPLPRGVRVGLGLANVAIFLLMAVPSVLSKNAQDVPLTYGSHTAVFLILLAETAVILVREGRRGAAATSSSG